MTSKAHNLPISTLYIPFDFDNSVFKSKCDMTITFIDIFERIFD